MSILYEVRKCDNCGHTGRGVIPALESRCGKHDLCDVCNDEPGFCRACKRKPVGDVYIAGEKIETDNLVRIGDDGRLYNVRNKEVTDGDSAKPS